MVQDNIKKNIYVNLNDDVNNPRFIPDGMNELERNVKRVGDMMLAGFSLIVFSPLFAICYFLVKKEDGGPAIFKQERIGRFGRPFYIYKFRSMRVDAEKDGPQLFAHKKDERMTHIGRFCVIITSTSSLSFGMSSRETWHLLDRGRNANTISIRSSSTTHDTSTSIRSDRE